MVCPKKRLLSKIVLKKKEQGKVYQCFKIFAWVEKKGKKYHERRKKSLPLKCLIAGGKKKVKKKTLCFKLEKGDAGGGEKKGQYPRGDPTEKKSRRWDHPKSIQTKEFLVGVSTAGKKKKGFGKSPWTAVWWVLIGVIEQEGIKRNWKKSRRGKNCAKKTNNRGWRTSQ